jgi:hypothetical protein
MVTKMPSDKQKFVRCQSISYNLLVRMDRSHEGISVIREIMDTKDCDEFYNLEDIRNKTTKHINAPGNDPSRMSKILDFTNTEKDKEIANQVASEYLTWYGVELRKSLTYTNWLTYGFVTRYDQFVYLLGFSSWVLNKSIKFMKTKSSKSSF